MRIGMLGLKAVPGAGGIEQYVEQVGTRLADRGHEVSVYCRRQYLNGDRGDRYRGMNRIVTPGVRGKYLDAITHTMTAAVDSFRRKFDIIHLHGSAQSIVAPLLRLRNTQRVVATIHALDWQGAKWGSLATLCMRGAARVPVLFAHRLTTVSEHLCQSYRNMFRVEPTYVPTGVEMKPLLPPDRIRRFGLEGNDYILCVARLVPEKGCHLLLEAFEDLNTDKKLVFAGGSNYRDPYAARLQNGADDRVVFTGYVGGALLQELYSNAYVYVQPSLLEGLCISVLEALSYGRCVLASDVPGNAEALDGQGHTFAAGDAKQLRRKLSQLLDQPDLVAKQFEPAREYISARRSWDNTTLAMEQVYRAVAGQ